MSGAPQLFRIDPETQRSEHIEEVDFGQLGFRERRDIQEWVAANPTILGDGLLIVGKEFSGFDRTNERLDLLAVDYSGKLVVIELKRDDTGSDAHWQAIKYASFFQRTTVDEIVGMSASYWGETTDRAFVRLSQHLGADDLNALNNDQRIILVSHRFAPEVTSAVMWLNQKVPTEDMVTCVRLTPYHDVQSGSLYVQASTIIPVPDVEIVGVGANSGLDAGRGGSRLGAKLQETFARNRNDEVTRFFRAIDHLTVEELPSSVKPDRTSRWGGAHGWGGRYYHFWYDHQPWSNWGLSYQIDLHPQEDEGKWRAEVYLGYLDGLDSLVEGMEIHPELKVNQNYVLVDCGTDTINENFARKISDTMRRLIQHLTPIIEEKPPDTREPKS